MATSLTEAQLKSALTDDQMVKARTRGLAEGDTIDPVAEEITAACAKVDTFAAGWVAPAAMLTGWARDLAAWHVAKRLDVPTEAQTKAKERAEKELEDLRDGKFPDLARAASGTSGAGQVIHGGRDKVL